MLPGAAAVVYLLEEHEETTQWSPKAVAGDIHLDDDVIPLDSGTLGLLAKESQPLLLSGANLVREDYAHLHARRTPPVPGLCSHDRQPDPDRGGGSGHLR